MGLWTNKTEASLIAQVLDRLSLTSGKKSQKLAPCLERKFEPLLKLGTVAHVKQKKVGNFKTRRRFFFLSSFSATVLVQEKEIKKEEDNFENTLFPSHIPCRTKDID